MAKNTLKLFLQRTIKISTSIQYYSKIDAIARKLSTILTTLNTETKIESLHEQKRTSMANDFK